MLQANLGWPSDANLKDYVNYGQIINCPIAAEDINRANVIYGPQVPLLKGKTVRRHRVHVANIPRANLPHDLVLNHPADELDMDHFYVNSVCFLHTKSREIKLLTSNLTKTKEMAEAYRHINHITRRFANRGFTITQYHGDNAFKALEKHLGAANLHIVANEEHVPTIERSIRVVKE